MYTIKRTKSGRYSIVIARTIPGKSGRRYSNGRKVPSGKRCYKRKTTAKRILKKMQEKKRKRTTAKRKSRFGITKTSSYGKYKRKTKRKTKRKRKSTAPKHSGWAAAISVNPNSRNGFSVYKVYKYRFNNKTWKLMKQRIENATKFFVLGEFCKFRKNKKDAIKDKNKYHALAHTYNPEILELLKPVLCGEGSWNNLVSDGNMYQTGGKSNSSSVRTLGEYHPSETSIGSVGNTTLQKLIAHEQERRKNWGKGIKQPKLQTMGFQPTEWKEDKITAGEKLNEILKKSGLHGQGLGYNTPTTRFGRSRFGRVNYGFSRYF